MEYDDLLGYSFVTLITALLTLFVFLIGMAATTSGRVEYCYTETADVFGNVSLKGSVDWRPDDVIGRYHSHDEAIAAADKLKCPLEYGTKE